MVDQPRTPRPTLSARDGVIVRLPAGGARVRRRYTRFGQAAQAIFCGQLAETGNVCAAARAAGVDRNTAYKRRADDPAFAARWRAALDLAFERIADELLSRALEGYDKPIVHGGAQTGAVRTMDTALMQRLLTAHQTRQERRESGLEQLAAVRERAEAALDQLAERLAAPLPSGLSASERGPDADGTGEDPAA